MWLFSSLAALGVPGLTFMTRYICGDNVQRTVPGEGKEWERNTDITYVVQDGTAVGFYIQFRNKQINIYSF
ncbi:MAG: OprD family outer membrane porin [Pseudomonas sp.]